MTGLLEKTEALNLETLKLRKTHLGKDHDFTLDTKAISRAHTRVAICTLKPRLCSLKFSNPWQRSWGKIMKLPWMLSWIQRRSSTLTDHCQRLGNCEKRFRIEELRCWNLIVLVRWAAWGILQSRLGHRLLHFKNTDSWELTSQRYCSITTTSN